MFEGLSISAICVMGGVCGEPGCGGVGTPSSASLGCFGAKKVPNPGLLPPGARYDSCGADVVSKLACGLIVVGVYEG
jgi:hypothetical protein